MEGLQGYCIFDYKNDLKMEFLEDEPMCEYCKIILKGCQEHYNISKEELQSKHFKLCNHFHEALHKKGDAVKEVFLSPSIKAIAEKLAKESACVGCIPPTSDSDACDSVDGRGIHWKDTLSAINKELIETVPKLLLSLLKTIMKEYTH